jgi:dynein heavy chain 2, cytosolic
LCITGHYFSYGNDLSQVDAIGCLAARTHVHCCDVASDEDTDVKAVVKSWLRKQPAETRSTIKQLINDYFYPAFQWICRQAEFVVETTLIGTVLNGLSHLNGVHERSIFTLALIRGLGGNLTEKAREAFAREVRVQMQDKDRESRRCR